MKRAAPLSHVRPAAAFTLIEMIGVLAIMAILASVLVPNVLRSLDRAAVDAEAKTLAALGDQVKLYAKINGAPPQLATWQTDLGTLADLAVVDILTNRRGNQRRYILDTGNPSPRLMIISSMRAGLAIPAITAAQFQTVWQTADKAVPPGWATWAAVANSGEQLLIERVNLQGTYQSYPPTVTITFNTTEATAAGTYSFRVPGAAVDSGPFAIVPSRTFTPGTILTLYSNGVSNYTYAVGSVPRTFDLKTANWIPQP